MNLLSKKIVSFLFVASMLFANGFAMERKQTLEEQLYNVCRDGNLKKVKELLKNPKIDVNAVDEGGKTPLSIACYKGHTEVVKELLKSTKTDVNKGDFYGQTPLHFVCYFKRRLNVAKELLKCEKIDINAVDEEGGTPLYVACLFDCLNVVKELLKHPEIDVNKKNNKGEAPFYVACKEARLDIIKEFFRRKDVDFYPTDKRGISPITWACVKSHSFGSYKVINKKKIETLGELLKNPRIDVNEVCSYYKLTPFHIACEGGFVEVVKLLLLEREDININCKDKAGRTPLICLMSAYRFGYKAAAIVELLLSHPKIDLEAKDSNGLTVCQIVSGLLKTSRERLLEKDIEELEKRELQIKIEKCKEIVELIDKLRKEKK